MGQGYAGHAHQLLNRRGGPVGKEEDNRRKEQRRHESEPNVPGNRLHHRPHEGKVPEVPDIYVDCAGHLGQQQHHVEQNHCGNNKNRDVGAEGDRRCRRPAHIDNAELNAEALHHRFRRGAQIGKEDVQYDADSHEAHAHHERAPHRSSRFSAERNCHKKHDNREKDTRPEIKKELNHTLNRFHEGLLKLS